MRQLTTPGLMQLVALTVFPIAVPASTNAGERVDLTLFTIGVFVLSPSCCRTSHVMSGEFTHLIGSTDGVALMGQAQASTPSSGIMIAWIYARIGCVNMVAAVNPGGGVSPFGDITILKG